MIRGKFAAWLALARLPFHTVGVLPFALGNIMAWRLERRFRWDVAGLGTLGVVLVMLAAYLAGEYWDFAEDAISGDLGRSRFAGGSGVLQAGLVRGRSVLWASIAAATLALALGVVMVLVCNVGAWALPLGITGLVGGYFYSARPIRWVGTGWGEIWIALCYGWLPVAAGYYLQANSIVPAVHWISVPIGLTIFNVILLNEFPDYPADRTAGKSNLTVRLGPERAAFLFVAVSVASWGTMLLAIAQAAPALALGVYLPALALSVAVSIFVLTGRWRDRAALEKLCGTNLLVNLGTTIALIIAFSTAA